MKIIVLSDTHIPRVAQDLPKLIYDEIRSADMVMHAGDFVDEELFEKLGKLKKLKAVCGNMDSAWLRRVLNTKEIITAEKVRIGLIHGYGAPRELVSTVRSEFQAVDAIVFGHSHTALNTVKDGILLFNPGSPTDNVFAKVNSFGILEIKDKDIQGRIINL